MTFTPRVCVCCDATENGSLLAFRPTRALVTRAAWLCDACLTSWQVRRPVAAHARAAANRTVSTAVVRDRDPRGALLALLTAGRQSAQPEVWLDVVTREIAYLGVAPGHEAAAG